MPLLCFTYLGQWEVLSGKYLHFSVNAWMSRQSHLPSLQVLLLEVGWRDRTITFLMFFKAHFGRHTPIFSLARSWHF
jgi:hypothetical protein